MRDETGREVDARLAAMHGYAPTEAVCFHTKAVLGVDAIWDCEGCGLRYVWREDGGRVTAVRVPPDA